MCVGGGGGGSGSTCVQNLLAHSHISEFWFHKLLVVGLGAMCLHDNAYSHMCFIYFVYRG